MSRAVDLDGDEVFVTATFEPRPKCDCVRIVKRRGVISLIANFNNLNDVEFTEKVKLSIYMNDTYTIKTGLDRTYEIELDI